MVTIKRLSNLNKTSSEQSFLVGDLQIKSDYADYKNDELVLFIPKGTQLPESFTKQNALHRTKSYKENEFYKTKEDVALPLRLVFPTEPMVKDEKGVKQAITLVESDYDFSQLIGARLERDTSITEEVSVDEPEDVQVAILDEQALSEDDEEVESEEQM